MKGGTLTDGAAFGALIGQVDLRVGDRNSASQICERIGVTHIADLPFAAAAVKLDYDESWAEDELLWIIRMKNGDVLYLHQLVYIEKGPQIYNFGAPAYDMRYTAEDGVRYRIFLSNAKTAEKAEPCEEIRLAIPQSGEGQFVSLLWVAPEGGTLAEGAAFGDLIEQVDIRVSRLENGYDWTEFDGIPHETSQPFAAAAVTLDYDEFGSRNELLWILHMKNGDSIYLHQHVYVESGARIHNAGAPAVDMWYTAADGVNYRLFLSFAETAEEAKPCEEIRLPLPEGGKGQLASLLCAVPEGGALEDGAAFGELIEHVELRAEDRKNGTWLCQRFEAPRNASRPFAAAAATMDVDERWSSVELSWILYMKNGDVIYLHHFVYVGDAEP